MVSNAGYKDLPFFYLKHRNLEPRFILVHIKPTCIYKFKDSTKKMVWTFVSFVLLRWKVAHIDMGYK